jgi:hypothetical protein
MVYPSHLCIYIYTHLTKISGFRPRNGIQTYQSRPNKVPAVKSGFRYWRVVSDQFASFSDCPQTKTLSDWFMFLHLQVRLMMQNWACLQSQCCPHQRPDIQSEASDMGIGQDLHYIKYEMLWNIKYCMWLDEYTPYFGFQRPGFGSISTKEWNRDVPVRKGRGRSLELRSRWVPSISVHHALMPGLPQGGALMNLSLDLGGLGWSWGAKRGPQTRFSGRVHFLAE